MLQDGKLTEARRLLAGFCAGITEALIIVTPFEVVKIKLQQQRGMRKEDMRYTVRTAITAGRTLSQQCSCCCWCTLEHGWPPAHAAVGPAYSSSATCMFTEQQPQAGLPMPAVTGAACVATSWAWEWNNYLAPFIRLSRVQPRLLPPTV